MTVDYQDLVDHPTDTVLLRITINNNTSAQANSVLGNQSAIRTINDAATLETNQGRSIPGRLVHEIQPLVFFAGNAGLYTLNESIIGIMTFLNNFNSISGFKLEYIN